MLFLLLLLLLLLSLLLLLLLLILLIFIIIIIILFNLLTLKFCREGVHGHIEIDILEDGISLDAWSLDMGWIPYWDQKVGVDILGEFKG